MSKYCVNCGRKNTDDAKVCAQCGYKFTQNKTVPGRGFAIAAFKKKYKTKMVFNSLFLDIACCLLMLLFIISLIVYI